MNDCGKITKPYTRLYNTLYLNGFIENPPAEIKDDMVLYHRNFIKNTKLSRYMENENGQVIMRNGRPVTREDYFNNVFLETMATEYGMNFEPSTKVFTTEYPEDDLPYIKVNMELLEKLERFGYEYRQDLIPPTEEGRDAIEPDDFTEESTPDLSLEKQPEEVITETTEIKPGVPELFEANPELANAVYEALGFKTKTSENEITRGIKEVLPYKVIGDYSNIEEGLIGRRQYEIKIGDDTYVFEISNYNYENEDGTYQSYYDIDFTVNGSEELVGTGFFDKSEKAKQIIQAIISQNFGNDTIRFNVEESKKGKQRLGLYKRLMSQLGYNPSDEIEYALFYDIKTDKVNLTPQQKQQAQQLYSQYLDTIFPNSKVKDIVYHGSDATFDGFLEDNLNYFGTKEIAKGYGKNLYPVVIEINKPYYEDGGNLSNQSYEDLYDKLDKSGSDGFISNGKNLYVPKTEEQIHRLGTKQDIEGFKDFIGQKTTTSEIKEPTPDTSTLKPIQLTLDFDENKREQYFRDFYSNNQNIDEDTARDFFDNCML